MYLFTVRMQIDQRSLMFRMWLRNVSQAEKNPYTESKQIPYTESKLNLHVCATIYQQPQTFNRGQTI